MGGCVLVEDVSELLGAVVGDFNTDVCLICCEGCAELFLLGVGSACGVWLANDCGPSRGVTLALAVSTRVLLVPTAHLSWRCAGERDDVKGVEHVGGVLERAKRWRSCCPWKGSSVAIRTPARKSFPSSASQFLYTVPDLPGTRSSKRAVG